MDFSNNYKKQLRALARERLGLSKNVSLKKIIQVLNQDTPTKFTEKNFYKKMDEFKTAEDLEKKFKAEQEKQRLANIKRQETRRRNRDEKKAQELAIRVERNRRQSLMNAIKQGVKNQKPRIVSRNVIDAHGKFKLYNIELSGVNTLKQLYDIISLELERLGDLNFITLFFEDLVTSKVRSVSIKASNLFSYDDFTEYLQQMRAGNIAGSDALTPERYNLLLDDFRISTYSLPSAYGSSDNIIFECVGIESKNGNCVRECFEHLNISLPKDLDARLVSNLITHISTEKIPVKIILNSFLLTRRPYDIIQSNGKSFIEVKNKKRKEKKLITRLNNGDIEIAVLYEPENEIFDHILIYDEVGCHMDIIKTNAPTLKNGVFLSAESEIIMNEKIIFRPKQIIINAHRKTTGRFEYLFFDYETIIDFSMSCVMRPYSLSVLRLTEEELTFLERYDTEKNQEKINEIREKKCMTFLGYDCNERFINWFCKQQQNTTFCFVGFNNTNFDNFILLDGLLRHDQRKNKVSFNVDNVFYNGNQLLNFKINGRHSIFDIHKHLCFGSLADNCKSFKINCCSKKSFNHATAQRLHESGELENFILNNDELREYNEYDVLATAVLFQKYRMAISSIPSAKPFADNIKNTTTIGSLIYKIFTENLKTLQPKTKKDEELKPFFPKLTYKQYKDLRKYKIAGRVELFNGIQKINERLASTDVCSLYPFVMAVLNVYYPHGDIIEVDNYAGDERIGFYYCNINQSTLRERNLPKIYARKSETENDWGHEEVLHDYLISNVMIGLLRKYGCEVVVKHGFVFSEKKKSCQMFNFLLDMMKAKNEQDEFKANKDPCYNPALRETLKLLMNALSGKVIEGLHTEKTTDFNNDAEFLKIQQKSKNINFINCIGNKLFATYEMDEEEICETQQRPIFLGVLIYDYAKRYMFENSYSKIGLDQLVYTDTDASKFRYSQMNRWTNWIKKNNVIVPHWADVEKYDRRYATHLIYEKGSKVFGSFEDELEDCVGDEYTSYFLEKKSWLYSWVENGVRHSKFRFKGISQNSVMLNLDEPIVENVFITNKRTKITREEIQLTKDEYAVYNFYDENQHRSLKNFGALEFYDRVYETGEAYVLTQSFRKIVKNSLRGVELHDEERVNSLMNKVVVNYAIKHVNINKKMHK